MLGVLRSQASRIRAASRRLDHWIVNRAQPRLDAGWAIVRRRLSPHVTYVGVTGSCGKTTTTRLIGAVLESAGRCRTSAGQNGPEDVARNVRSVGLSTKFCVQEISGSCPGRIEPQVRILKPHIGVVTTIGSDHYRNFRSLEATAAEKGRLVEGLPAGGIAILNIDDPHIRAMSLRTRAKVITYGRAAEADIGATEIASAWPTRLSLTVRRGREHLQLQTQLVGEQWTTSVLAAIACGTACGLTLEACAATISGFEPVFGRSSVHSVPGGPDFVLETAKAPYWTLAYSLAFVGQAHAPRKTMVFGTISDYPGSAGSRYRRTARAALELADRVVFVGPQSGHVGRLRQGALMDRLFTFASAYQASAFLAANTVAAELIYIKASQRDHLERIMLSQCCTVMCWHERCGIYLNCPECPNYRLPHPPPAWAASLPLDLDSRPTPHRQALDGAPLASRVPSA